MLATEPAEQAGGLGKRMLACAERYAADALGARTFRMSVLVSRSELVAFYVRRGYMRSGRLEGFPDNAGAGVPRVPGLLLETLFKEV
jgi:ribosomal protein S18 acetylase RimI-like enzyme